MWTMCDTRIICISISIGSLIMFSFIFLFTVILKVYIQLGYVFFGFTAALSLMYGASKEIRIYILAWVYLNIPAILWGAVVSIQRMVDVSKKTYLYDAIVLASAVSVALCGYVVGRFVKQIREDEPSQRASLGSSGRPSSANS